MQDKLVKILIADDDFEDLELIEDAFLRAQPAVELQKFTSGKKAIDFLNSRVTEEMPSLIILDYNMPELSGSQVLSYIKDDVRYLHIPKVIWSTSNAALHMHECISNGATEYVVKPDNIKGLDALVKKLLALCKSG